MGKCLTNYKKDRAKERVIKALKDTKGHISKALEQAGVSRTAFYEWKKNDAEFRQAVEDTEESLIDFVESKLMQNINAGDVTSIIFYLKTKGRNRGYQEKQEIDISALRLPQIELQDCDHEELEKNFDLLEK